MGLMEQIKAKAKARGKHIVLPEGREPRIVEAAAIINREGIAQVTLLGELDVIQGIAAEKNLDLTGVKLLDPAKADNLQEYADAFYEMRKAKGMTPEKAHSTMLNPMYYGTMMVKLGAADGLVAGALCTTADTLRPGLQIIKTAPGVTTVSSCFVMDIPNKAYGDNGMMVFGDCAINIEPTAEQLAAIAIAAAATARDVVGMEPRVAMLSFSTKGSGKGDSVDKVVEATRLVKEMAPELNVDGELQADAAIVESVGKFKSPGSPVAGKANVLIFPEIQSGNIGYKLVQRLAGADAVGPICQGFAKPINDLSRGCSVEDVVNVVALTALQVKD